MQPLINAASSWKAVAVVLGIVGCCTAGLITGHLPSSDFSGLVAAATGVSGLVGTAHVVGTQVNTAATSSTPAAALPAGPAPVVNTGTAGTV